jgi:hypothetical protein
MAMDFGFDVRKNPVNDAILSRWSQLDLPDSWLVAGCLFQTVWNLKSGRPPGASIIFYFDPSDLSERSEREVQALSDSVLGDLGVIISSARRVWPSVQVGSSRHTV